MTLMVRNQILFDILIVLSIYACDAVQGLFWYLTVCVEHIHLGVDIQQEFFGLNVCLACNNVIAWH